MPLLTSLLHSTRTATLCVALLLSTQTAHASIIVYADRATWQAAVGSAPQTEDFEGLIPAGNPSASFSLGLNNAGLIDIELSGDATGSSRLSTAASIPALNVDGSDYVIGNVRQNTPTTLISLLFPQSITAFGADWAGTLGFANLTVTVDGQLIKFSDHLSGSGSTGGTGFLGLLSTQQFTRADLNVENTTGNEAFGLDNVSFSTNSVPAPSSLLLLSLGLAGIRLRKRNSAR